MIAQRFATGFDPVSLDVLLRSLAGPYLLLTKVISQGVNGSFIYGSDIID